MTPMSIKSPKKLIPDDLAMKEFKRQEILKQLRCPHKKSVSQKLQQIIGTDNNEQKHGSVDNETIYENSNSNSNSISNVS